MSNLIVEWEGAPASPLTELVWDGLVIDDFFEGSETETSGVNVLRAAWCEEVRHGARTGVLRGPVEVVVSADELYSRLITCTGEPASRPIDCFKSESGWVRTSVTSPAMLMTLRCRPLSPQNILSDSLNSATPANFLDH